LANAGYLTLFYGVGLPQRMRSAHGAIPPRQHPSVRLILRLLINAAALWVAARYVPGISYAGSPVGLFGVALVFGVINVFVKPLIKLFSLPVLILTLGLFTLVINALMLWLTSAFAASFGLAFHVAGFGAAFWGALVVSIVSMLLAMFLVEPERQRV
jgi:putative membrane protein